MSTDSDMTTGFDEDTPWKSLYEQAAADGNDFVTEVRSAVSYGMNDPEDSVQIACAAAETAEASVQALSGEWSLYTPQEAATVAAALFEGLQQNADALAALRRSVGRIIQRGETELTGPAGPGQPANLADALDRLLQVAGSIYDLVNANASTTVRALHGAPATAPIGADAHGTLAAVSALLKDQCTGTVTFNERHGDGEYDSASDHGFGCGCDISITLGGEEYSVSHGDSEWTVVRMSDAHKGADGTMSWDSWGKLSTSLDGAHPQQLVDDVLRIVTP